MPKGNYKGIEGAARRVDAKGDYRAIGTGEMIREHLTEGPDYVMNIWRAVCDRCKQDGYYAPSYESFRKYFGDLKKLNLVLPANVSEQRKVFGAPLAKLIPESHYEREFYKLNATRANSVEWLNPHKYLYTRTGSALR